MPLKSIKCPCEGCLCVPMCRNKPYNILVNKCFLINNYLIEPYRASKRPSDRLKKVYEILQPIYWNIRITGATHVYIKQNT